MLCRTEIPAQTRATHAAFRGHERGYAMRILTIILAAALFLSACETIKGVGRDVENTGEAIDDAVDEE